MLQHLGTKNTTYTFDLLSRKNEHLSVDTQESEPDIEVLQSRRMPLTVQNE